MKFNSKLNSEEQEGTNSPQSPSKTRRFKGKQYLGRGNSMKLLMDVVRKHQTSLIIFLLTKIIALLIYLIFLLHKLSDENR